VVPAPGGLLFDLGLPEPFGGPVGGALELLEPSQVNRAAPVDARSVEVGTLTVVSSLHTQLIQPQGLGVGHGHPRRDSRSASAARFTGDMLLAFVDPSFMRRATCLSFTARSLSLRLMHHRP
jgi:hypothetical protein